MDIILAYPSLTSGFIGVGLKFLSEFVLEDVHPGVISNLPVYFLAFIKGAVYYKVIEWMFPANNPQTLMLWSGGVDLFTIFLLKN